MRTSWTGIEGAAAPQSDPTPPGKGSASTTSSAAHPRTNRSGGARRESHPTDSGPESSRRPGTGDGKRRRPAGREVIRVISNTKRMESSPAIVADQDVVTCPGLHRTDTAREGTPGTYTDGDPVHIRLGALCIGNVALTSVDGEFYSTIAKRLKEQSPMANTVVVTLANGTANSGYIPNNASFGAYTFQVLSSRLQPGCAEGAIDNGLLDLIKADER